MNKNDDIEIFSIKHNSFPQGTLQENIKIQNIEVSAYTIPTQTPEADGTLKWNSTTLVLVEITAAEKQEQATLMQTVLPHILFIIP